MINLYILQEDIKEDNKGLIAFFSKEGELLFTIRGLKRSYVYRRLLH